MTFLVACHQRFHGAGIFAFRFVEFENVSSCQRRLNNGIPNPDLDSFQCNMIENDVTSDDVAKDHLQYQAND